MPKARTSTHAHDAGRRARQRGFDRISPYYGDLLGDYFFLAGFDGVALLTALDDYNAAVQLLPQAVNEGTIAIAVAARLAYSLKGRTETLSKCIQILAEEALRKQSA